MDSNSAEITTSDRTDQIPLWDPFRMLRQDTWRCTMYLIVSIAFGTIGITASVCMPLIAADVSFSKQVTDSLARGDLYSFVIALVVSTSISLKQSKAFIAIERTARMKSTATLASFAVVIGAALFSGQQALVLALGARQGAVAAPLQVTFFLAGCAVAFYWFLISIYEEAHEDFAKRDLEKRDELGKQARDVVDDGGGLKL